MTYFPAAGRREKVNRSSTWSTAAVPTPKIDEDACACLVVGPRFGDGHDHVGSGSHLQHSRGARYVGIGMHRHTYECTTTDDGPQPPRRKRRRSPTTTSLRVEVWRDASWRIVCRPMVPSVCSCSRRAAMSTATSLSGFQLEFCAPFVVDLIGNTRLEVIRVAMGAISSCSEER